MRLHLWETPEPLFQTDPENRGAVIRCAAWPKLWEEIKMACPSLVIVDPVSAALADADTSQTGPARTFLREVSQRGGDRRLRCVAGGARHQRRAQPGDGRTRPPVKDWSDRRARTRRRGWRILEAWRGPGA